jgi:uncharacterized membrane protein
MPGMFTKAFNEIKSIALSPEVARSISNISVKHVAVGAASGAALGLASGLTSSDPSDTVGSLLKGATIGAIAGAGYSAFKSYGGGLSDDISRAARGAMSRKEFASYGNAGAQKALDIQERISGLKKQLNNTSIFRFNKRKNLEDDIANLRRGSRIASANGHLSPRPESPGTGFVMGEGTFAQDDSVVRNAARNLRDVNRQAATGTAIVPYASTFDPLAVKPPSFNIARTVPELPLEVIGSQIDNMSAPGTLNMFGGGVMSTTSSSSIGVGASVTALRQQHALNRIHNTPLSNPPVPYTYGVGKPVIRTRGGSVI